MRREVERPRSGTFPVVAEQLDAEQIDELAAALILPNEALGAAMLEGLELAQIARRFGCEEALVIARLSDGRSRQSGWYPRLG